MIQNTNSTTTTTAWALASVTTNCSWPNSSFRCRSRTRIQRRKPMATRAAPTRRNSGIFARIGLSGTALIGGPAVVRYRAASGFAATSGHCATPRTEAHAPGGRLDPATAVHVARRSSRSGWWGYPHSHHRHHPSQQQQQGAQAVVDRLLLLLKTRTTPEGTGGDQWTDSSGARSVALACCNRTVGMNKQSRGRGMHSGLSAPPSH